MSLTRLVPKADIPIDRLWMVFFGEGEAAPWWARFLKPGFRHVVAVAWFAEQERWVYVNPSRRGTVILLYRDDEFGLRLQHLIDTSGAAVRMRSKLSRSATPFGWWCTGAVKALLGVRCGALSPWQLHAHLLRQGAVAVELPRA